MIYGIWTMEPGTGKLEYLTKTWSLQEAVATMKTRDGRYLVKRNPEDSDPDPREWTFAEWTREARVEGGKLVPSPLARFVSGVFTN